EQRREAALVECAGDEAVARAQAAAAAPVREDHEPARVGREAQVADHPEVAEADAHRACLHGRREHRRSISHEVFPLLVVVAALKRRATAVALRRRGTSPRYSPDGYVSAISP